MIGSIPARVLTPGLSYTVRVADGTPEKVWGWIVEQAILCVSLAPLSILAYSYRHRLAFSPGSSSSGEFVFSLMSLSMMCDGPVQRYGDWAYVHE